METALYGGSFNPLHIGHLAILRKLADSFDRIYLVVSPKNPLKDNIDASSAETRLKAASEALLRHPELCDGSRRGRVILSDIEFRLPSPNYSINTLDALAAEMTDALAAEMAAEGPVSLTMVVGGDQIADIRRWKDYERILLEYGVAVFPREGCDLEAIRLDLLSENPDYKIRLMDMPEVPVSSSEIRLALSKGQSVDGLLM